MEDEKVKTIADINEIDNVYAKTGKDNNKRFKLNGSLVTINNKITELNEKVAAIEYKKIAIKNEIDILNGNAKDAGNRIPVSSHAVIKYQPVKEFSLELWDLMLEKAIVYKDHIEFVWKE